jgi:hypothetical protein
MKKVTLLLMVFTVISYSAMSQWGKGMLIKQGTTVTEESGTTIYIHGGADWTLLLEDNTGGSPSFMVSGDVKVDAGSDSVRFQQYLTKDAWHYVSPAVTPTHSSDFLWMYLYKFEESTRSYVNIFNDNKQELTMGRGYAVWNPSNGGTFPTPGDSLEQKGIPISTDIDDYALSYAYSGGTAAERGWNIVGNPFTVAMDWSGNAAWDLQNVDATIYLIDQDDFAGGGNGYETYNWSTGLATNGADSIISAGQAFFVHANAAGARMDFPMSERFHRPFKELTKAADNFDNFLRLTLQKDGYQNEMIIAFDKNTVEGVDPLFDAYHLGLNTSIGEIYASEGDNGFVQYWSPSIENHEVVPVSFEAHSNGAYSLVFSGVESFDEEIPVWLEDIKTGEWQNLRDNNQYSFAATTDDEIARFAVHFAAPTDVEEIEDANSFASIFTYEKNIHINIPMENFSGQAYVYDLLGKEVLVSNIGSGDNLIEMNDDNTYFIVKLVGNDNVVTKKVFIH